MEKPFQLPPLLIDFYILSMVAKLHGNFSVGSRGKILDRIYQQTGGKLALNRRGWAICCHCFAQSNSVVENKQTGAALMRDQPPWRECPLGESLCNEPPEDPLSGLKNCFLLQQCKLPALSFCF